MSDQPTITVTENLANGLKDRFFFELTDAREKFKPFTISDTTEPSNWREFEKFSKAAKNAYKSFSLLYYEGGSRRNPYIAFEMLNIIKERKFNSWNEKCIFGQTVAFSCSPFTAHTNTSPYSISEHTIARLFYRHLAPLIKHDNRKLPLELSGLEMTHYKILGGGSQSISLQGGEVLKGTTAAGTGKAKDPEMVRLEELVSKLNDLFPEISDTDRINLFKNAKAKMMDNEELVKQAMANEEDQFVKSPKFDDEMMDSLISSMDSHKAMTTKLLNDPKLRQRFKELLARDVYKQINQSGKAI